MTASRYCLQSLVISNRVLLEQVTDDQLANTLSVFFLTWRTAQLTDPERSEYTRTLFRFMNHFQLPTLFN